MAKLFFLALVGYGLYGIKLVDDDFTDKLSILLVRIIFPALIISRIVTRFSFTEYHYWWVLPLSASVFAVSGMTIGFFFLRFLKGFIYGREFMCASGFQNCGYLPMTLIVFSFDKLIADRMLIYVFLFIAGFDILMWSLVPLFLTGKLRSSFSFTRFFNPPVMATVFSLLWVALWGKGSMPSVVMEPLAQLGDAAFPLSMLILGAYLCRYRAHDPEEKGPILTCLFVKLLVFPLLVLAVFMLLPITGDYKFFLFLQAVMPSAISLVVVGAYTGANNRFLSSVIFYGHLIAIFSIPLWLQIYNMIFK